MADSRAILEQKYTKPNSRIFQDEVIQTVWLFPNTKGLIPNRPCLNTELTAQLQQCTCKHDYRGLVQQGESFCIWLTI
jgi:hypothetical protein